MRITLPVALAAFACVCLGANPGAGVEQRHHPVPTPDVREWPKIDTTLDYYVSRSDAIVECTITKTHEQPLMDAAGLVYHECDVMVAKAITGKIRADEALRIFVPRWKNTPGPTPGKRYIMFFNQREAQHQRDRATLADIWFGVQPYDELMAGRLKLLTANPKKESASTKPSAAKE
jgi:hypothetical protein